MFTIILWEQVCQNCHTEENDHKGLARTSNTKANHKSRDLTTLCLGTKHCCECSSSKNDQADFLTAELLRKNYMLPKGSVVVAGGGIYRRHKCKGKQLNAN